MPSIVASAIARRASSVVIRGSTWTSTVQHGDPDPLRVPRGRDEPRVGPVALVAAERPPVRAVASCQRQDGHPGRVGATFRRRVPLRLFPSAAQQRVAPVEQDRAVDGVRRGRFHRLRGPADAGGVAPGADLRVPGSVPSGLSGIVSSLIVLVSLALSPACRSARASARSVATFAIHGLVRRFLVPGLRSRGLLVSPDLGVRAVGLSLPSASGCPVSWAVANPLDPRSWCPLWVSSSSASRHQDLFLLAVRRWPRSLVTCCSSLAHQTRASRSRSFLELTRLSVGSLFFPRLVGGGQVVLRARVACSYLPASSGRSRSPPSHALRRSRGRSRSRMSLRDWVRGVVRPPYGGPWCPGATVARRRATERVPFQGPIRYPGT